MSDTPTVSVLVCTYDRPDHLARCLESIAAQTYENFEIVVVQGPPFFGERDATDQVIAPYSGRIKLGQVDEHNVAKARNQTLRLAAGDIIALIDDDAIAAPNWLRAHVIAHKKRVLAGVGGFARTRAGPIASRVVVCDSFGTATEHPTETAAAVTQKLDAKRCFSLTGYNASFRRDAVLEAGGFDETYSYMLEETDLCFALMRNGHSLGFAPNAWVIHEKAQSVDRRADQLPRNMYRTSQSIAHFCRQYAGQASDDFLEAKQAYYLKRLAELATSNKLELDHVDELSSQVKAGFRDGRSQAVNRPFIAETVAPSPFLLFA